MPPRNGQPVDIYRVKLGQSLPDLVRPELTTYHYDLQGNLDWQLSDQLFVATYDGLAEYRELTDYTYDSLGRLDKLTHAWGYELQHQPFGDAPFAEFDYELRADGKRIGVTEKLQINDGNGNYADQTERIKGAGQNGVDLVSGMALAWAAKKLGLVVGRGVRRCRSFSSASGPKAR